MKEKTKTVPRLRFPGFSEEWEKTALGEIAKFINGRAYSQNELKQQGKYPVLRVGNFFTNDNWYYSDLELSKEKYAESGDLLYAWSASFGPKLWHGPKVIYHYHIWKVMNSNKIIKKYLYYWMGKDVNNLYKNINGGTMNHVTLGEMVKRTILYPSLPEQEKIADFFSALDEKIDLKEKEIEDVKALKKGFLQKMFPQDGESVPRLRFPGFSGKWETSQINKYFTVKMCKRIFKEQTITQKEIPFYKIGTLGKNPDCYISYKLFKEMCQKSNMPQKGDTLISCSGTVGNCILYDGQPAFFQDSNIVWLESRNNYKFSKKYLYYMLRNLKWNKLSKTTITRIYTNDLLSRYITIPSLREQEKIADFFTALDAKIDAMEKQLEDLKEMKKGFLQQMFI